jgi:hypothetical protein
MSGLYDTKNVLFAVAFSAITDAVISISASLPLYSLVASDMILSFRD